MKLFSYIDTHEPAIKRLRFEPEVTQRVHDLARLTGQVASDISPVRTGHYLRSYFVRRVGGADPHSVVGARDFKAWWIEYGTTHMRAFAPFRRALKLLHIKYLTNVPR